MRTPPRLARPTRDRAAGRAVLTPRVRRLNDTITDTPHLIRSRTGGPVPPQGLPPLGTSVRLIGIARDEDLEEIELFFRWYGSEGARGFSCRVVPELEEEAEALLEEANRNAVEFLIAQANIEDAWLNEGRPYGDVPLRSRSRSRRR